MGLETIVAIASLTAATVGIVEGREARKDNRRAQEKIQKEQNASNAAKAALERRQQIREERVKRARILQAGENSGTAGGSGEAGAVGSLASNLSANIGFNLGALQRGQNMSIFAQDAANAAADAQGADQLFSLGLNIFGANGGFGAFNSPGGFQGGSVPINNSVGTPQAGG